MSKLTKSQFKAHNQACEILKKDVLTEDDKFFVLENWHEGATNNNAAASAYFTPMPLALDLALESGGARRVLDLCAGVGALSFATSLRGYVRRNDDAKKQEFVCVELNPEYIKVGKKIMPEATWIQGDATDIKLINSLGHFDCVISNPPFGKNVKSEHKSPRYTGSDFEFKIMDIARDVADHGVFLIPQLSASFRYSDQPFYKQECSSKVSRFIKETGVIMEAGAGVDTSFHSSLWKTPVPTTEIVCIDFEDLEQVETLINIPNFQHQLSRLNMNN